VTELPHNDNNGAWYGLFGNMAVQIMLLGVKCGRNIFFSPALLLKPNVTEKNTKTHFLKKIIYLCIYFQIAFVRHVQIAIGSA
jgi:hypothetical protein